MRVLAVDPGTTQSAWCLLDDDGSPIRFGIAENAALCGMLQEGVFIGTADVCAIEMVASYGMAVGKEVFRTVWWSGRFAQAWFTAAGEVNALPMEVFRKEVVTHLCGSAKGKDANVRQALIDRYGGEGGKDAAIGKKKSPGPLYGFSKDAWAALGVAVTAQDKLRQS